MRNDIWGPDWPALRRCWGGLDPAVAHLNHGSFGAVPDRIQRERVAMLDRIEANPMRFFRREYAAAHDDARRAMANFVNADIDGFVFVDNVTTGVVTALRCVPMQPGDEVLVFDQAYGAIRLAVEHECRHRGMTASTVALPPGTATDVADELLSAIKPATRVVVIEHVAASTGRVFPIYHMIQALAGCGVYSIVDAAHAPGMMSTDVDGLEADFWVGAFDKWMCAPHGASGLVVGRWDRANCAPLVGGWHIEEPFPESFTFPGSRDPTAELLTTAARRFLDDLGRDRVVTHNRALADYGAAVVADALGTAWVEPPGPTLAMRLVALPGTAGISTADAKILQDRIAVELHAETTVTARDGRAWMRLSAHVYNCPEQYERLGTNRCRVLPRWWPTEHDDGRWTRPPGWDRTSGGCGAPPWCPAWATASGSSRFHSSPRA